MPDYNSLQREIEDEVFAEVDQFLTKRMRDYGHGSGIKNQIRYFRVYVDLRILVWQGRDKMRKLPQDDYGHRIGEIFEVDD